MRKLLFIFLSMFFVLGTYAQVTDSSAGKTPDTAKKSHPSIQAQPAAGSNVADKKTPGSDSGHVVKDTASAASAAGSRIPVRHSVKKNTVTREDLAFCFPQWFYHHGVARDASLVSLHEAHNSGDTFFYCLLAILFFTGLIRVAFPRYFRQVFQFILQPRVRKKNLRDDRSAENTIPSILLNLLFVITCSLCIVQLARPDFTIDEGWRYWAWCALSIAIIYTIKFIVIKFSGWIFDARPAASVYNYVVFSINKILGIIFIPVIVFAAYGAPSLVSAIYSASGIVIIALLSYRYIASFILLRGNLKVSVFHFFLYLCAIEILPLLIAYKILLMKFGKVI